MKQEGMTLIVKTISRIIVWMIFLYGAYIILHGHLTPGGGFAGGVVLALGFLSILIAYGKEQTMKWLNLKFLEEFEATSILLFIILGIAGLLISGTFLLNMFSPGTHFRLISAGQIPILNILIGIKVGASLFLVVFALSQLKLEKGE